MSLPAVSFCQSLRRFRDNRTGGAAIEFAIVAPVFFALLFAIIETALMFFAGQVLETMTEDAARMILTGQAQTANYQQADFHKAVCDRIPAIFSCGNLYVDVESFSNFSSVTLNSEINGVGQFQSGNMQYNPGGPGDVVVVRVFYPWQLFVTGLGWNPSNLQNNQRLLVATAAFQNEPYSR